MDSNDDIERVMGRLERAEREAALPQRWRELDKRTIEFIARLNEEERRNLIALSHLSKENLERIHALLALSGETWDAGIKLATRSVRWTKLTKRAPAAVMGLAAFIAAFNTIWGLIGPYIKAAMGFRP